MTQALYRRWRPRTFEEVVGQEHVIRTLRNALVSGRIHHAYLFAGPRGTGKTTTARLLAKAVNCLAPEEERPCNRCAICRAVDEGRLLDLIEIDAASHTQVEDTRELLAKVGFRPNQARYKVYVIDEVHMLSSHSFNALLKTLEEPPPHAIFVLATTEPHKIPATVLSRCQRFDFRRIPLDTLVARLEQIVAAEGIAAERDALLFIAHHATGSMRDAESLLDQLISYGDGGITVEAVQAALGTGTEEAVFQIAEALARQDVSLGLTVINRAVDEGADSRQLARQVVEHLRSLLLLRLKVSTVPMPIAEGRLPALEEQAASIPLPMLTRGLTLFSRAAGEARRGWQAQLPLEMALIETVLAEEATSPVPPSVRPVAQRSAARAPQERTPATSLRETPPPYPTGAGPALSVGALTAEALADHWEDFLNALRPRNLSLEALMRSCKPVSVGKGAVVLAFEYEFHRSKVEEEQNRRAVEDALEELTGKRYRVRCVLASQAGAGGAPSSAADDPVVRFAVESLGAQVRPVTAG